MSLVPHISDARSGRREADGVSSGRRFAVFSRLGDTGGGRGRGTGVTV